MTDSRDYILIYLNGERRELRGAQAFMTLSDYLRHERLLTGTKVVCAEGDCGACSVLVGAVKPNTPTEAVQYQVINSCIQFMHGLDCSQIITIEGLPTNHHTLHPIQTAMVNAQATQCGFCTPGFVMAAAGMLEQQENNVQISVQQAKNHLTGNLCRCTGYLSIVTAMTQINTSDYIRIKDRYHAPALHADLLQHTQTAVSLTHELHAFHSPIRVKDAAEQMTKTGSRIFASATDLGVQHNKGHWHQQDVVSLNLMAELHQISIHPDHVHIGARVTMTEIEDTLQTQHPEWVEFMHLFASPQIKNNGTLVGNIANGSPIGDHLPFLLALDAKLHISGPELSRTVNLNDFYLGYKKIDLAADEVITGVDIPNLSQHSHLKLYKVSQRRDLDISCVSAAIMMTLDDKDTIQQVSIALGGVAATALRIPAAEQKLLGLSVRDVLDPLHAKQTAEHISTQIKPMSDVRGSQSFRQQLVHNLYLKFIDELITQREALL